MSMEEHEKLSKELEFKDSDTMDRITLDDSVIFFKSSASH